MKVFKLRDLSDSALFARRGAGGGPPFFAVLGSPVSHSLSPLMQNAALGRIAETDPKYAAARYFAFEISPGELPRALETFKQKNFSGLNVTLPLKEEAARLADTLDSDAEAAGACNTLSLERSVWRGYNTDGFGIVAALKDVFGVSPEGRDVFVFGAGGAARGIVFKMADEGCASLTILNRSADRMEKLADEVLKKRGFKCFTRLSGDAAEFPAGAVVINATPVGLKEGDAPVADFSLFPESAVFFDAAYRTAAETSSVLSARRRSIRAESGLAMLAWQGAKSLSIWTGKEIMGSFMLNVLKGCARGDIKDNG